MSLKIIAINNKLNLLVDSIFKISLGLFIIIFFSTNVDYTLEKNDRIIIILSGFILILLVDYIKVIDIIKSKKIFDDDNNFNSNYDILSS